ncbi:MULTISPECIES: type IV toxin-antitoxin system AbiEi family antitoxin domain-containing protein [Pseudonocardia]|uniref:AbiEi antitoxin N-terminal domain-containing protein n=2 Tax=Pseudonocardia TaxID=1847 RepID=A0A1Y2N614_PSEAH|nr:MULTISPECIES: type IV toxin-antitoxin system AbiEi family antitoxin domain-containing protein [Pseudonocardia]OSY42368.1 hypothetical protein BG845_01288 [Pseudonocardia autotrophica]TDN75888.1 putative AbiEi antitoxin of type IV toxin-antitoxin system [Pseudonocardia autotrophica]BBF99860.1 hypothetical protein Pdca_10700 [Pseudonocardia autotrophica]GEC28377.1 hypothetical protein PSA01_54060 [Pseudonocardia saturnea]
MFLDAVPGAGPFRRADLHAAGLADSGIAAALRAGQLRRVCRGMYVPGPRPTASGGGHVEREPARHLLAVRGVLARLGVPAVVSHASAAIAHGLDVWDLPLDLVHLTRDRPSGARRGRDLHLHVGPLSATDVTYVGGLAVTTPARTAIDIAREQPFAQAIVVADAALRAEHTDRAALTEALRAAAGRTGVGRAARVVEFADGRSASPGESRSRLLFHRSGLPEPVLQREIAGRDGERLATVDFWWGGTRPVVGEFDGEIKYGRLLRPGQTPRQAVVEEKIREDLLRELGLEVVRWTWRDLDEPQHLLARLRRRLARRNS